MIGNYNYGTGRRKSAVARVFIKSGSGQIVVNGKPANEYFSRETGLMVIRQPLELTNNVETFDIMVNVNGCLLYTSPSPRDLSTSRMPSSA